MAIFKKPILKVLKGRTKEMPGGLWTKCPSCGEVIHNLSLEENLRVCPKCAHHFTMGGAQRVALLADAGSFKEIDAGMTSVDSLRFTGVASYGERLASYQARTGLKDAVITGVGALAGRPVALAVMDFNFLAATMGSVVGEKITRLVERATREGLPVVIVAASGGARMYEGMLSLMQMAKTCGALAVHARERLPFLSVLTNPTTAGVMASFASVGDLIFAEPRAMIGFAGPRVIRETTHQDLPEGFQTAEFLEQHGLIDAVVHRAKLKDALARALDYTCGAPAGARASA
jgi:acetyl-CoA carboxylase carboxyl transferase subunit beta